MAVLSQFISWLAGNISIWWHFMESNNVPGTGFSFATLYLFIVALNVAVMILRYVISKRIDPDHSKGGGTDPNQVRFWR